MPAGVFKAHRRQAREFWSPGDGQPLFCATMRYGRFSHLCASLRFDDSRRRDPSDKLVPIRTTTENLNISLSLAFWRAVLSEYGDFSLQ